MPTLDELREAREAFDGVINESGSADEEISIRGQEIDAAIAYIAALESDRAAQQRRIVALTEALEPFALMGYLFLQRGRLSPPYTAVLYGNDERGVKRSDFEHAYHALHADAQVNSSTDSRGTLRETKWAVQAQRKDDDRWEDTSAETTIPIDPIAWEDVYTTAFLKKTHKGIRVVKREVYETIIEKHADAGEKGERE